MPRRPRGAPSKGYASTSKDLRKGEVEEILGKITDINQVKRESNGVIYSANLHLDSRLENNWWKVDIQFKNSVQGPFRGKTIATVMVSTAANNTSLNDFREAFREAMRDTQVIEVT